MKKIAFTLYVSAIIIMFPLYIVLELGYLAQRAPETIAPVSVIEKVEEPGKAFVKAESGNNNRGIINRLPPTVNTITYTLLLHHIQD